MSNTEENKPEVEEVQPQAAEPSEAAAKETPVAADKGFKAAVDRYFGISARKSSFSTEIFAGLTTFLAMAYILVVNPGQILYAGTASILWPSVFIATALGAVIGC